MDRFLFRNGFRSTVIIIAQRSVAVYKVGLEICQLAVAKAVFRGKLHLTSGVLPCYNLLSASSVRKEVELMAYIVSFVISVAASVAAYYICKWLDRK